MSNKYFQKVIKTKIEKMLKDSKEASMLDHPGLKGQYREYSLINLLKDFLPINYGIGKGCMQDFDGNQSPESDLLIWRKDLLPPLLYSDDNGIYPIDSCYYFFEIKSVATSTTIKDGIRKADKIRSMRYLANYDGPIKGHPIKVFFAYESDSDEIDELSRFEKNEDDFNLNPKFDIICIANKGYWVFNRKNFSDHIETEWMFFPADGESYEILGLLAGIINTIAGRYKPSFGYYILENEASGKGKFIRKYRIDYKK